MSVDNDPRAGEVETWSEGASETFIELGDSFVPWRRDIACAIIDLMPVERDEAFLAVELGVGTGWLTTAVLEHFHAARAIGYDGSDTMLAEARRRLIGFGRRAEVRPFRLQNSRWVARIGEPVRAFFSCLVVHHLDGLGKRDLYRHLLEALEPGGAVLIADVIEPSGSKAQAYYQKMYEDDVPQHSLERTGCLDDYNRFLELEWNLFRYPDPVDTPSTVAEHLDWLRDAGFTGVEVFWARSGHALYGGYRPRAGSSGGET